MSRNTRKATESTPTTDNNPVGVAVGVSAEEVEDIVAKAVYAATTVVRDEFMKHINDLHQRLQLLEFCSFAEGIGTTRCSRVFASK